MIPCPTYRGDSFTEISSKIDFWPIFATYGRLFSLHIRALSLQEISGRTLITHFGLIPSRAYLDRFHNEDFANKIDFRTNSLAFSADRVHAHYSELSSPTPSHYRLFSTVEIDWWNSTVKFSTWTSDLGITPGIIVLQYVCTSNTFK